MPLPERSLRLLEVLAASAGRTVSKDRLVEEVWNGASVSDTSLTEAMSRLRRALGDAAREPRYIRTVHGRGYRLISPVTEIAGGRRDGRRGLRWFRRISLAASMALVGALGLGSLAIDADREPAGTPARFPTETLARILDPGGGVARILRGIRLDPSEARPRYRLAEVSTSGSRLSKYPVPALPLNDLSVDRRGDRLAFSISDGEASDVWVFEPRRGELKRVAGGGAYSDPVWTPDGKALAMAQSRNGSFDLMLKDADRDGPARVLLDAPLDQFPESWARDGRTLVYSQRHPETGFDLWLLRKRRDDRWVPEPLVRTAEDEAFGAISPDGRYVAYVSRIDERPEVHVADLTGARATVRASHDGGAYPFWSVAGDRLHYVKGDEVWTAAADPVDGGWTRASRTSTRVTGLYLAASVSSADRMVVAMLD